jgi:alpha-D-ribose 1-methylphosphonate 5-triphosphate synthase subunit PhnG
VTATNDRKQIMRVLAHATEAELEHGLLAAGLSTDLPQIRLPETGLTMVRGRIGGDGRPFNLGEMTITRAAVESPAGHTGVAYLKGRCPRRARLAAAADAYWQNPETRAAIETELLAPIEQRLAREHLKATEEADATKVDFFTMVRGED